MDFESSCGSCPWVVLLFYQNTKCRDGRGGCLDRWAKLAKPWEPAVLPEVSETQHTRVKCRSRTRSQAGRSRQPAAFYHPKSIQNNGGSSPSRLLRRGRRYGRLRLCSRSEK